MEYNKFIESEELLDKFIRSLLPDNLNINITSIRSVSPKYDLSYYMTNKLSCFYTVSIEYTTEFSTPTGQIMELYFPKLNNRLCYFNRKGLPNLKTLVNIFKLKSPYWFKLPDTFRSPEFTIEADTIVYNEERYPLCKLNSLNLKLGEKTWKKLNLYNKNIISAEVNLKLWKSEILPTLQMIQKLNDITYYDLELETVLESFLLYFKQQQYLIRSSISTQYKLYERLYGSSIQKFINSFFVSIINEEVQTSTLSNAVSLDSQMRKVYIKNKKGQKIKVKYNKFLVDFLDPVKTHEGNFTGIRNELSNSVDLPSLLFKVKNKRGKVILLDYFTYYNSKILIRSHPKKNNYYVRYRGEVIQSTNFKYQRVANDAFLSTSTSMIPFLNSTDSVRGTMGATMIDQSIPVLGSKPNIIYTEMESTIYNNTKFNITAQCAGVLKEITEHFVLIQHHGCDTENIIFKPVAIKANSGTYNNYQVNDQLSIGDEITENTIVYQLDSFKFGEFTTFVPTYVAYMNYKGYTYEDGLVMSESLIKAFSHPCNEKLSFGIDTIEKINFIVSNNEVITSNQTILSYERAPTSEERIRLKKLLDNNVADIIDIKCPFYITQGKVISIVLYYKDTFPEHLKQHFPKIELMPHIDVNYIISIEVSYANVPKLGDKFSNRFGSKGVVVKILPDHEMPHDSDGTPIQLIMSPDSVINRKNLSQLPEVIISKTLVRLFNCVERFGVDNYIPIFKLLFNLETRTEIQEFHNSHVKYGYYRLKVDAITELDYTYIISQLETLGFNSMESLIDPITGRKITNILTGYSSIMRLHFIVEQKAKVTSGYKENYGQLIKHDNLVSGMGGTKRKTGQKIGEMEVWSFVSYNNIELLKELHGIHERAKKATSVLQTLTLSGIKLNT